MNSTPREVRNPLSGKAVPKGLIETGIEPEIQRLWTRRKLRLPVPTSEILPLQAALWPVVKQAWRNGNEKDISWMVADLAGLWEVSRSHIFIISRLLKKKRPMSRSEFRDFAEDLQINWLTNASGHMRTLKAELAKFTRALYPSDHSTEVKSKRRTTGRNSTPRNISRRQNRKSSK